MALVAEVAQAVTDALNAGDFSQVFTAERAYRPQYELSAMRTLRVSVVPHGVETRALDRTRAVTDIRIDVGVQKKLESEAPAEVDPLMELVAEIAGHFRQRRLAGLPRAVWIATENAPLYAPEHLQELRQFTSVVTFTFRVMP